MMDAELKRKILGGGGEVSREQEVYFWFNSKFSRKGSALYKLKLVIIKELVGGGPTDVKIAPSSEGEPLEMVELFFEQTNSKLRADAACAPFVASFHPSCKYLLLPNQFDDSYYMQFDREPPIRESPCVYTFGNGAISNYTTTLDKLPHAIKINPMAVTVDNKVYVLSRRKYDQLVFAEPSFEAYDPLTNSWEGLPQPWFNDNSSDSNKCWESHGYAVLDDFIIVSSLNVDCDTKFDINSYDTRTRKWKPVSCPDPPPTLVCSDDPSSYEEFYDELKSNAANYLVWDGEAVVINNYIYAHVPKFNSLASIKCRVVASSNDHETSLSLSGSSVALEPFAHHDEWLSMMCVPHDPSGAVGKIADDLICFVKTVKTLSSHRDLSQPVHLMTFRLHQNGTFRLHQNGGICTALQSFDLLMHGGSDFAVADISSCFTLPPEVASKSEHEDPMTKEREVSYTGADAASVSDMEVMYC